MILGAMARDLALDFDAWTIVEPEPEFQDAARAALGDDNRFSIVEGYLDPVLGHTVTTRVLWL